MVISPSLHILGIFLSPGHNFFGRARDKAEDYPLYKVSKARLVAGRGIEGDRYFDYKPNYKGQVTFFANEVYQDLCKKLNVTDKTPEVFRRNIVTEGFDLNDLIGEKFEIQGIEFQGSQECSPCLWMDRVFAPGAFQALKNRGGLRARILTDGILRVDEPILDP